jgi:hypothetical protein
VRDTERLEVDGLDPEHIALYRGLCILVILRTCAQGAYREVPDGFEVCLGRSNELRTLVVQEGTDQEGDCVYFLII